MGSRRSSLRRRPRIHGASGARSSCSEMTATSRLRVGIAGLGRLGRRHADNLARRVPRADLIAACSPIEDELAWAGQDLGVASLYGDYRELLADVRLDAVFLVTPTSLHAEQI